MIARMWHGVVPASKGDDYLDKMRTIALPDYRSTPGNVAAYCLREHQQDGDHFLMVTIWNDEASISLFAGEDISLARYYDFDDQYLLEKEQLVRHFEAF